jgi:hypothetical protein
VIIEFSLSRVSGIRFAVTAHTYALGSILKRKRGDPKVAPFVNCTPSLSSGPSGSYQVPPALQPPLLTGLQVRVIAPLTFFSV